MWRNQPEHKSQWLCGMCGTEFPSEDILITHLGQCQLNPGQQADQGRGKCDESSQSSEKDKNRDNAPSHNESGVVFPNSSYSYLPTMKPLDFSLYSSSKTSGQGSAKKSSSSNNQAEDLTFPYDVPQAEKIFFADGKKLSQSQVASSYQSNSFAHRSNAVQESGKKQPNAQAFSGKAARSPTKLRALDHEEKQSVSGGSRDNTPVVVIKEEPADDFPEEKQVKDSNSSVSDKLNKESKQKMKIALFTKKRSNISSHDKHHDDGESYDEEAGSETDLNRSKEAEDQESFHSNTMSDEETEEETSFLSNNDQVIDDEKRSQFNGPTKPSIMNVKEDFQMEIDEEGPLVFVYHCWVCGEDFQDKWSIVLHLKDAHADRTELFGIELKMRSPICLECGSTDRCEHRQYTEEDSMDRDDIKKEPNDVLDEELAWPCSSCPQSFVSQKRLQRHRDDEHDGGKNFQCSFCPSQFVSHSHLVAHARIHTGFRPHPCNICGNRFARRSDLERHTRTHTGEKPFKCVQCDRTFSQRSSLEKHARIHARRSGGIACEQCGLVFQTLEELSAHSSEEHTDRKFSCDVCGKNFSAQHYLSLHKRTHTIPKEFCCSFCSKKFSFHTLLVKHEERIHKNQGDIKCNECGRIFKRKENLTRHLRSHTGEKSFLCPACGQGFTEKGSMKRHYQSVHEQIKPHDCILCSKSFSRKFLLNKHIKRHHPDMTDAKLDDEEEDDTVTLS